MNKTRRIIAIFFVLWMAAISAINANEFTDAKASQDKLKSLAGQYPDFAKYEVLTSTPAGNNLGVLTLGRGNAAEKPAIAVVGGIEGPHLFGTKLAIEFAEKVLSMSKEQQISALLDSVCFYVIPSINPDAAQSYFASLRYERRGNGSPADLDRDGRLAEDGYEDLNNDGLITMMRIADPTGKWMPHPADERIMVEARPSYGETGTYIYLTEGIDNDNDKSFNEDGEEGVIINRNFAFSYPFFTTGSGEHAMSETETRAISDFLYDAKNVFAVVSFGPANNLTKPLSYNERDASARIHTSWKKDDITVNEQISHLYNKHLSKMAPTEQAGSDGDFFQWAYFHYGRFSFSTPGWTFPDTAKTDKDVPKSKELNFLQWAEANQIENTFVPWAAIDHPDFPGKKVEVGGLAPFAMINPPANLHDTLAEIHTSFLLDLARMRPRIEIREIKTERLGRNLYRVTADIVNMGDIPTASQTGEMVRWMQKTVIRLTPSSGQEVISGDRVEVMGAIGARSSEERSWIIKGNGTVLLRAGGEPTGFDEKEIKL
jgi:hypothetical protein